MTPPQYAVLGHVEWIDFVGLSRWPQPGDIVPAAEHWQDLGGGGAVAAAQLAKLGARVHFFTAFGDDELGHRSVQRLRDLGVEVKVAWRPAAQRRAITLFDQHGERTIVVLGPRLSACGADPLPWELLSDCQAVYITAGDRAAIQQARQARVVVGASRILKDLIDSGVRLEAIVGSQADARERFDPDQLATIAALGVLTRGAKGGDYWQSVGGNGHYEAAPVPGPAVDAYGCGDSFAAGLTFALGARLPLTEALELAARCGAACLTGRGPYPGQLRL